MRTSRAALTVVVLAACVLATPGAAAATTSRCQNSLSEQLGAFAKEKRLAPREREAVAGLVAQMRAHPLGRVGCSTGSITMHAAAPLPGRVDELCLQALNAAYVLSHLPRPVAPTAVHRAASRAYAVMTAAETRGATRCVVPRRR